MRKTYMALAALVILLPSGKTASAQTTSTIKRTGINFAQPLIPRSANSQSQISIHIEGDNRVIYAKNFPRRPNGFSDQPFPTQAIPQTYNYQIPLYPTLKEEITPLRNHNFGVALDGILFNPGAPQWYKGERASQWQFEPFSGDQALGQSANIAQSEPGGPYHYHSLPHHLLRKLDVRRSAHSPIIGWAADGFPIYALYSYANPANFRSGIKKMRSSYKLKTGKRPSGAADPGGYYDGTFIKDYEFAKEVGELDECNGRYTRTPEFPGGTYAYFITETWPRIPRCFKGTPSASFTNERFANRTQTGLSNALGPPPSAKSNWWNLSLLSELFSWTK